MKSHKNSPFAKREKNRGNRVYRTCFLAVTSFALLLFCLYGCTPRSAAEKPKEIPVGGGTVTEQEQEEASQEQQESQGSSTAKKQKKRTLIPASVTVTTVDGQKDWKTNDDILSESFYELLFLVNETFRQPLDIREHDYNVVVTDLQGKEETFKLWVNFEKENEVIVEDREGSQWNLFLSDSDEIRRILNSLS